MSHSWSSSWRRSLDPLGMEREIDQPLEHLRVDHAIYGLAGVVLDPVGGGSHVFSPFREPGSGATSERAGSSAAGPALYRPAVLR